MNLACFSENITSTCTKTQVADKKASFLRLSKLEKCEFTAVNDHFESKSNEKNGVFFLTLTKYKRSHERGELNLHESNNHASCIQP